MPSTYRLINVGLNTIIRESNIAVVKKINWDISEDQIPAYLSNYSNEDIKLGQLISSDGDTNTYRLDTSGPGTFNLVLFVNNGFTLEDPDLTPSNFSCLGAIEIPEIGFNNPDTTEFLKITFNEIDPAIKPEDIEIIKDISIEAEVYNYEQEEVGYNKGIVPETEAREFFPTMGKYELGNPKALSFVPGGVVYFNQFFPTVPLELDFSVFTGISKVTPINHGEVEYLRILDINGDVVLRDLFSGPSGTISKTSSGNDVTVLKEVEFNALVNPDFITVTNLVNRTKFRIPTPDYKSGGYTKISDIPESSRIQLNRFLEYGTDLYSQTISTVASRPGNSMWFLQSSFRDIFKSIDILQQDSIAYKVIEHNTKIFILAETNINGATIRTYAVDYKGNVINIPSFYLLDIDGYLIVQSPEGWVGYKSDLSTKIRLSSIYDLYTLIPSGSELIWNNQNLDFTKIVICRDRFQEII